MPIKKCCIVPTEQMRPVTRDATINRIGHRGFTSGIGRPCRWLEIQTCPARSEVLCYFLQTTLPVTLSSGAVGVHSGALGAVCVSFQVSSYYMCGGHVAAPHLSAMQRIEFQNYTAGR